MAKPLTFTAAPRFYGLLDWVWDQDLWERAAWIKRRRPFVGLNPTLERATNGR